jgi:hypothetical protein
MPGETPSKGRRDANPTPHPANRHFNSTSWYCLAVWNLGIRGCDPHCVPPHALPSRSSPPKKKGGVLVSTDRRSHRSHAAEAWLAALNPLGKTNKRQPQRRTGSPGLISLDATSTTPASGVLRFADFHAVELRRAAGAQIIDGALRAGIDGCGGIRKRDIAAGAKRGP